MDGGPQDDVGIKLDEKLKTFNAFKMAVNASRESWVVKLKLYERILVLKVTF